MFINFDDIRTDIDRNADNGLFEGWYWYTLDCLGLGCTKHINYKSYLMGCPLPYSQDDLDKIEKARERVEEARMQLDELIKGEKKHEEEKPF